MRTKTTLFLFVLLAALVVLAYTIWIPAAPGTDGKSAILSVQDAAQLDYLAFGTAAQPETIVLQKANGVWRITAPVNWPASVFAVDRLLSQLQFFKKVSSFPAERLSDYGLDPPVATLTYGAGPSRKVLGIGKSTDLEKNVYLLPDDHRNIIVAHRRILDDLQRPLEELRSDSIFGVPIFEVRSWVVQVADARVNLQRAGESWRIDSPIRARADTAAVDTLLKRVLDLRVESFWSGDAPDLNVLGLVSPAFRITIVSSGSRDSLLLGNPVDATARPGVYHAKREDNDTVFTVRVDAISELRNAQIGLRDRRVVDVNPARLLSLVLTPAGQPSITLQKLETGTWQVQSRTADRGPVTMEGDPDVINALVEEIVELRAARDGGFVSDAPSVSDLDLTYGLTGAAWQIQIVERAPGNSVEILPPKTISLGRRFADPAAPANDPRRNLQYAQADEGFVYLVDRGLADDLHPEAHYYRQRLLRRLAAGESITALTLTRLANDEVVFSTSLAGPDQSWPDALITQKPERRAAALAVLQALQPLRAAKIVAPEFTKSVPGAVEMRPWTWVLEVTIAQEGGATQKSTKLNLYLDSYPGGTELLMGVPDLDLAVGADPAFIDAIRPLIFPREDPGVPPPAPATPAPAPAAATP